MGLAPDVEDALARAMFTAQGEWTDVGSLERKRWAEADEVRVAQVVIAGGTLTFLLALAAVPVLFVMRHTWSYGPVWWLGTMVVIYTGTKRLAQRRQRAAVRFSDARAERLRLRASDAHRRAAEDPDTAHAADLALPEMVDLTTHPQDAAYGWLLRLIAGAGCAGLAVGLAWLVNHLFAAGQASWMYGTVAFGAAATCLLLPTDLIEDQSSDRWVTPVDLAALTIRGRSAFAAVALVPLALLVGPIQVAIDGHDTYDTGPGDGQSVDDRPAPGEDSIRHGVTDCLNGELPDWVDPQTGQDFCDGVTDLDQDLSNGG